jgi:hypothetical protein
VSSDLCSIYILSICISPYSQLPCFSFLMRGLAQPWIFSIKRISAMHQRRAYSPIHQSHESRSCGQHEPANENIVRTSSYTPWTHKRQCLEDEENYQEYCVYTDANFAHGRGISFFTSREIAKRVESLPAFLQQGIHDKANRFDDTPWEIRNIPGRGNGLFATRTLYRGDEIIVATPVGVYHSQAFSADRLTSYQYLRKTFDQMPNATREVILRTAVNEPGDPIMERINTNAFLGDFEGAPHFLLYPETAVRRQSPHHVIPTNSLFSAHEP